MIGTSMVYFIAFLLVLQLLTSPTLAQGPVISGLGPNPLPTAPTTPRPTESSPLPSRRPINSGTGPTLLPTPPPTAPLSEATASPSRRPFTSGTGPTIFPKDPTAWPSETTPLPSRRSISSGTGPTPFPTAPTAPPSETTPLPSQRPINSGSGPTPFPAAPTTAPTAPPSKSPTSIPTSTFQPSIPPSIWEQRGSDINGRGANDYAGYAIAMSEDGSIVAVGAFGGISSVTSIGTVRVYECWGSTWIQRGQDLEGESDDWFGFSVAMSKDGSVLAVGAVNADYLRVYEWTGIDWMPRGHDIVSTEQDQFEFSVAISNNGSLVAVGERHGSVAARVFVWTDPVWLQVGHDIRGDSPFDESGYDVDLSDTSRLAVGTPRSNYVRVCDWTGGDWIQVGQDIDGDGRSGESIALSRDGSILAVSNLFAELDGLKGYVAVFKLIGGGWTQLGANIVGKSAKAFGQTVALSNNGLVLAARTEEGMVHVYQWNGVSWHQLGPDIGNETIGDGFGVAIDLSSDEAIIAIGAPYNTLGCVQVYERLAEGQPTPSPTVIPTSPTTLCFSGDNLVETKHRGSIAMKDLRIGDLVQVLSGSYEEVYTFGHKSHDKTSTYLEIYSKGQPRPSEVSKEHMVMVQQDDGQRHFARAGSLQVGDEMVAANGETTTVTLIRSSVRTGLYAPFTYSGTIVVSGIVASNYVAFQDSDYLKIGAWTTGLSYYWIAQQFTAGRRFLHQMGLTAETYTEDGIASWVGPALRWSEWLLIQNVVVVTFLLLPFLFMLCIFWCLEAMITMDFASLLLPIVAVVLSTAMLFHRGHFIVWKP